MQNDGRKGTFAQSIQMQKHVKLLQGGEVMAKNRNRHPQRSKSQRHVGRCLGKGAERCEGKRGKSFDKCMSKEDKKCM